MPADPTRTPVPAHDLAPAGGRHAPSANGEAAPRPAAAPAKPRKGPQEVKDTAREVVETVVFVVVLVLLLKTFVAEAFVIPTGSMAETLYGYQKNVTCPQCGHHFPVNCSSESEPQPGRMPQQVHGCTCPNCQFGIDWRERLPDGQLAHDANHNWIIYPNSPRPATGDRVLVAKYLYDDGHLGAPGRHDVVVFKYPVDPQANQVAMNYIKRCVGLPGETLAIFNGDLYTTRGLDYPDKQFPRTAYKDRERADGSWVGRALRGDPATDDLRFGPATPNDLWQPQNMFANAERAIKLFGDSREHAAQGKLTPDDFVIVRKSPARMMAMRRLVYDNDHQAADLVAVGMPPRWHAEKADTWTVDRTTMPKVFAPAAKDDKEVAWLRYQHLALPRRPGPDGKLTQEDRLARPITNAMGYNSNDPGNPQANDWVGDLMLECVARVTAPTGELVLELSEAHDRFQARFELATGICTLVRVHKKDGQLTETELDRKATPVNKAGSYRLRFANFDDRLTVWVDGALPFGDGVAYPPAERPIEVAETPVDENDLMRPASVGVRGSSLTVANLSLWRDTYYTRPPQARPAAEGDSRVWTYYVQPGHFLCLGDNSAESSDSRFWGLVPQRLLLGRAVNIYYPIYPPRVRVIQ